MQTMVKPTVALGQHWRRADESMDWAVVGFESSYETGHHVRMAGPGACRGTMLVDYYELITKWVRC